MTAPLLTGLDVSGTPDTWRAAGFAVDDDGGIRIGHVRLQTECGTKGMAGWSFAGLSIAGDIDGLRDRGSYDDPPIEQGEHPNGATLIDHVVVVSGDGRGARPARWKQSVSMLAVNATPERTGHQCSRRSSKPAT